MWWICTVKMSSIPEYLYNQLFIALRVCLKKGPFFFFFLRESSSLLDPTECMETVEEQRAHSPPASLVPRIHMLYALPLQHNNPLLPSAVPEDKGACECIIKHICRVCIQHNDTGFSSFLVSLLSCKQRPERVAFSQSWAASLPHACLSGRLPGGRVPPSPPHLQRVSGL